MLVSRNLCRVSAAIVRRSSYARTHNPQLIAQFAKRVRLAPSQFPVPHRPVILHTISQQFRFSSSSSPEPSGKENNAGSTNDEATKSNGDAAKTSEENDTGPATKDSKESDSDTEIELSVDDLKKLLFEKEELLELKHREMEKMQDKVLRAYADMENVMERTKRDAENSKKFAIQSFAKGLLDVADNLGRASSVVKESFSKLDTSTDSAGAVPLLKTLLEGVEMTEKQLAEEFRKVGIEKYDPINEPFDPNRHNAMFQVPDSSKPPGTIAHVLKAGYMLHDRVIRPAEVGVTQEVEQDSS